MPSARMDVTYIMDVTDVTDITDVAGVADITDIMGGTVRHMASPELPYWVICNVTCPGDFKERGAEKM